MRSLLTWIIGGRFGSLKSGVLSGAMIALAALLPMAVTAQDAAKLGGTLGVANVTAGDTDYKSTVDASIDQLVKVQLYYVNEEPADATRPAVSLRAKIELPTGGERAKVITSSVKGENTDALEKQVTVNTDRDGTLLQYIPGSATWKRNTGTAQTPKYEEARISDNVVTGAQGAVIGNVQPGPNNGGTISVLARVVAPGVKATLQSQKKGQTAQWSSNNVAAPGDTMRYMIGYQNSASSEQKSVLTRVALAPNAALVPGTTTITNASNPGGIAAGSDAVTAAGLVIGNYNPGANAFVGFDVTLPPADKLECGDNELRSTAVVRPEGLQEYFASALTIVRRDCGGTPAPAPTPAPNTPAPAPTPPPAATAPAPVFSCDGLTVVKLQGREVEIKVASTARNGAKLKSVTYDFGDDSDNLTTDKTTVRHTYANDGNFTVSASLVMTVNGKDQSVVSNACSQAVSFVAPAPPAATPTAPTASPSALPNTGTGEVLGLVIAVTIVGALGHRLYLTRKLSV